MSALQSLEARLEEIFLKQAPALPANAKKSIVEYLPWLNLVLGIITLWAVYNLWHWAHAANRAIDYLNNLSGAYGGTSLNHLSFMVWVSLIVLAAQALLYVAAFPALRDRKRSGWDLIFYALLVNVLYGFVVWFTDYGGFGSFLGSLIGSAIGLYFLFQIRSLYLRAPATS